MPKYLDLFAGAGGLSEGFYKAGYEPVAHVEMDEAACYTLKTRAAFHWLEKNGKLEIYDRYLLGEITRDEFYGKVPESVLNTVLNYEISYNSLQDIFEDVDALLGNKKLDIIIGGPPCQAYSIVGRARSSTNMVGDERNFLYRQYAAFLKKYKPKYFVFENVVGLLSAKDKDGALHLEKMRALFSCYGYSTEFKLLAASDYGVLQNRIRIILIGIRGDKKGFYPEIPKVEGKYTVSELLNDLPFLHAGEGCMGPTKTLHYEGNYLYDVGIKDSDYETVTLHQARPHTKQDLEIYRIVVNAWNNGKRRVSYKDLPERLKTHKNVDSFLDRFKVVADDLSCTQTVVAHIARDGHYYIHPDINQNRSLTPREAARIQTFPDNYYFESKKSTPTRTVAYRQIGNAVPVQLAYCVAKALLPKFEAEEGNCDG